MYFKVWTHLHTALRFTGLSTYVINSFHFTEQYSMDEYSTSCLYILLLNIWVASSSKITCTQLL